MDEEKVIGGLYEQWRAAQQIEPPPHLLSIFLKLAKQYDPVNGYESLFERTTYDGERLILGNIH